jgi:hypothetical protein
VQLRELPRQVPGGADQCRLHDTSITVVEHNT